MKPRKTHITGMMDEVLEEKGESPPHPVETFTDNASRILLLPLESIRPNPRQPRRFFDEEKIRELAESIKDRNLLQPIVVKRLEARTFLLVAGERRFRAYQLARQNMEKSGRFDRIPAIVREDDELELSIIENLQREDLRPLEEAEGLRALIDKFEYTQEELARKIRKSQPAINESLRLNDLPEDIKTDCHKAPHEYPKSILLAVVREKDPEKMKALWKLIRERGLTVAGARKKKKGDKQQPKRDGIEVFCSKLDKISRQLEILDTSTSDVSEKARMGQSISALIKAAERVLNRIYGEQEKAPP